MPVISDLFHGELRSADNLDYAVPRTKTSFADRAFTVAGPVVWNSLPASANSSPSITYFRKRRKTL